jgi:hypothetical protein
MTGSPAAGLAEIASLLRIDPGQPFFIVFREHAAALGELGRAALATCSGSLR